MVHNLEIDGQVIKETITSLEQQLLEFYVYPDIAIELCKGLRNLQFDGSSMGTADFCKAITKQLQLISKDRHLHMSFKLAEDKPTLNEELRKQELAFDNYGFYKVERLQGNIGYLDLHALAPPELAGETAVSAMNFLANTSGMIIDLRQCGGWSPYMVTFLSSYLLSETPVHLNDFYWRHADVTQSFWSTPYVSGRRFGPHKPVFVLTSKQTFSASEEFAYDLQAIERAIVVGEITGGGAHPGEVHRLNHYFEVFIPKGRAINPVTKSNWEGTGVIPDIEVSQEQAFDIAYAAILEIVREREKAAH